MNKLCFAQDDSLDSQTKYSPRLIYVQGPIGPDAKVFLDAKKDRTWYIRYSEHCAVCRELTKYKNIVEGTEL